MDNCRIEDCCEWQQEDWNSGAWFTDCSNAFWLEDGSPEDNKMIFCPFCGKKLRGVPYQQTKNGQQSIADGTDRRQITTQWRVKANGQRKGH